MILKLLKYIIFEILTSNNIKTIKKIKVISLAGIGDSIYAGIFCSESQFESTLYTSSKNIDICSFYYDKVFDIKTINYLEPSCLYYSDRSSLNLVDFLKILFKKSCFKKNSIYESVNLIKRIKNKLGNTNYQYYEGKNSRNRFYVDTKIKSPNRKYICVYRSYDVSLKNKNYIVIHPFGSDSIRRLTKNQIENILNHHKKDKVYIIGSTSDEKYQKEYNLNIKLTTFKEISDLLRFLSGAKLIICVDSMISHLASTLLPNPLIIYYGNTFSSYYMPQKFSNIKILNNYQKCTPCNKIYCNKINGLSCVQNIFI